MKNQEKEKSFESVERIFKQRKIIFLLCILGLLILWRIVKTYQISPITLFLLFLLSIDIFPAIYFIKSKKETISAKRIYFLIASIFTFELIILFGIFYFLAPLFLFYLKEFYFPITFFLTVYIIVSNPIFNNRNYSYYFFSLCVLFLITFGILDYYGLFPSSPLLPVENLYHLGKPIPIFIYLFPSLSVFFIIQFYVDNFWEMFRRQRTELENLNLHLEEMVKERTQKLEKAKEELEEAKRELEEEKAALEIKVSARTKELKDLAESLEEKVRERTKELEKKVLELEKFQKLAVGRELRIIELKKEIERLKREAEEKK
jgi:hypothetical protein